jgi:EmrB/QacA subfamily drug resistance transporter
MTQTTVSQRLDAAIYKLVATVTLGTIAVQLDSTMVSVAFNALLKDFHQPLTTIQWVATGYLLAMTTMIPLTGWAVERFGAKRVWMVCLVGFLVGSVLCGLSWSMGSLIVFRVAQGLGGGMLIPLAQIVLAQAAGPERFGRVASLMGVPMLLGPVLGPVLGGLIIDDLSWRWIFLVNVPIGLAGLLVSARVLPSARATAAAANRLDITGLALLSPGLAFIVYGLSEAGSHGRFTSGGALLGLVGGAALLIGFVVHALRTRRQPLIDLRLFRTRSFATAAVVTVFACLGVFGQTALMPLYYQQVRGFSPLHAGLLMAPQGIGLGLALIIGGRLSDKIGPRLIVLAGLVLAATGSAILATLGSNPPTWLLSTALVLGGAGLGSVLVPVMTAALRGLRHEQLPRASTAARIFQQIGISMAIASLTVILQRQLVGHLPADAFGHTFAWQLVFTAIAVVPALFLPKTLKH